MDPLAQLLLHFIQDDLVGGGIASATGDAPPESPVYPEGGFSPVPVSGSNPKDRPGAFGPAYGQQAAGRISTGVGGNTAPVGVIPPHTPQIGSAISAPQTRQVPGTQYPQGKYNAPRTSGKIMPTSPYLGAVGGTRGSTISNNIGSLLAPNQALPNNVQNVGQYLRPMNASVHIPAVLRR